MSTSTGEASGAVANDSVSQGADNSPTTDTSPPAAPQNQNNGNVPRPKRLGHACAYDEVRRKSGPKRGYVKALEERLMNEELKASRSRLEQVETLLNKTQEPSFTVGAADTGKTPNVTFDQANRNQRTAPTPSFNVPTPQINISRDRDMDQWHFNGDSPQAAAGLDEFNFGGNINIGNVDSSFPWEMIGLGLEEPLPPQETIDELLEVPIVYAHGPQLTENP
ncbi:hypothetical protein Daesc_000973 [Daldinia eschscholtzii]|uniref:Uncharacterized protein n=1 Tax=Daldinia eschscholtzii TaxID=292717 RepID=A0AAX6MZW0_9PEZI